MKLSEARSLLSTTFNNSWANFTPVTWDNTLPATPGTAFVRFIVQESAAKLESWSGSNQNWRHYGIVAVQVFVRVGSGTAQADDLSDRISNILRGRRLSDELTTYEATTRDDGPDGLGWDQSTVLVRFQYTRTTS